jgi:ATP-dependent exoDNAse (exonuclease V) beta subunit
MKMKVSDYTERQRAISPEGSFIVQAPAGSGKTELLIQRYLRLLGLVDHPEEIVAITFTRKAAAEMQGRIVKALERARMNVPPRDDATRITDELARVVLAQDDKHHWQLEQNPGRLRIQTIDALCAGLTRQMPVLAKFGAQPAIVEDASELYKEAAANTLAELESGEAWSEDIAVLLAHLDNNLPLARDMLAGMLARRDQWLRHVTRENRREELEAALKHIVESTLTIVRQAFPKQYEHEFLECVRYAADNLAREDSGALLVSCHGIDHLPGTTAMELPRWLAIADTCLTQKDEWRKQANVKIGFPAPTGSASERARSKNMKERFQNLLAQLSGEDELLRQLTEVRYLPPVVYTDNEWRVVTALCQLLVRADAELRVLCAERNQMDFAGIARAAIEALESEGAPTDLALHLDYQIKHLLIDEYQDVSINQYKLVEQLTAGWAPGDGHTLFLVGDPMQSIYRFREAEVGLFITTWHEQRLGQVPLTPLNITVNFRSQAGIVDWVNAAFSKVMPHIDDPARGAVKFTGAVAFHPEVTTDAVTVHPFLNADERSEADRVLELVQSARKKFPAGTTAILVRNRKHLINIVPALKQAGLKFRAVEIDALGQRPAIQDLLALTRALHHEADRIAWLACLRAPWCGLTLSDLLLLAGQDKNRTIRECMQDDKCLQALSPDGQTRLLKLRVVLNQYFTHQQRRSLRRAVESVWMSLGGPATLEDETDLENARTYFDLLEQFDTGGDLREREQFFEAVEKLYAAPDVHADDRLQIMTVHKAKGLEFDTVIVPGLHLKGRGDDSRLLLWTESPHGQQQDLLLAPVKEAGQEKSPIYEFVKRLEQERQQYEQGRLLYVAATRARHQLHLLGSMTINSKGEMGGPAAGSLLMHLWPVVAPIFQIEFEQHQAPESRPASFAPEKGNHLRRLPADWVLPAPPEPVRWSSATGQTEVPEAMPEYEWAGETIRHVGSVVHRYLQKIAEEGIDLWTKAHIKNIRPVCRRMFRQLGVRDHDLDEACDNVERALITMIEDERGRWILHSGYEDAHCEYRISGLHEGTLLNVIIDRTFVDAEGTRWVIDYKTSRHEGADLDAFLDQEQERYRAQLAKYGVLMRSYDEKPVRLGLYFPLLQGWREAHF